MKKLFYLSIFLLCGCVSAQSRFLYSNEHGHNVYQTDCSWTDFGDCLIEANKICPEGYDIIISSETPTGNFSNYNTNGTGNYYSGFSSYQANTYGNSMNTYKRYLIYACKAINLTHAMKQND